MTTIADWEPMPSACLKCSDNEYGFPTVVCRTPSRLVEECENAFDAGLLLAALTLVVTIPDVCANIDGTDYRKWCKEYATAELMFREGFPDHLNRSYPLSADSLRRCNRKCRIYMQ